MSSIIVKGMKMPENCWKCIQSGFRTVIGCMEWAKISAGRRETERAYSCPIAALPDKHGRLVDADALIEFIDNRYDITWKDDYEGGIKDACTDILEKIDTMPTIVEAEDGT